MGLSDKSKERIIKWGKAVDEIMAFYKCDRNEAWQILAVDNNWKTAVVAEKIDSSVQAATEKIDTVKRMKEEERQEKAGIKAAVKRVWRAVVAAAKDLEN